jgi:mono/diheme cytochrome c family protein
MIKRIWILMIFLLLGALSACGYPNPQPTTLTPIPSLAVPQETLTLVPAIQAPVSQGALPASSLSQGADGAAVYEKHCTGCHGVQGEGVTAPALRNNQFIQKGPDTDIYNTIADGRSGTEMPAWLQVNGGPLTDVQIGSMVAFLKTFQGLTQLPTATPMPTPESEEAVPGGEAAEEVARPSNPGDVGGAVNLSGNVNDGRPAFGLYCATCHGPQGREQVGIPNPGSDDGVVPELNPIDATLLDPDPNVAAGNVDLFIEHGSIPSGPSPKIMMPSFGDSKLLTDQQIADLIAYVLDLNGVTWKK